MQNPKVKEALAVIRPVGKELFSGNTREAKTFELNGETLILKYNPIDQLVQTTTPGGLQSFFLNSSLTIIHSEKRWPKITIESVTLETDEIAKRQFLAFFKFAPHNETIIKSIIATRPEYRGHGLGSGLFSLQDDLIQDLLKQIPNLFQNYPVIAQIIDLTPDKWSSYWAEQLGFTSMPPWQKRYQ